MQEAKQYRSSNIHMPGAYDNFKAIADGKLYFVDDQKSAYYVSEIFDCGIEHGTWDELHLHFDNHCTKECFVWIFNTQTERKRFEGFALMDRFYVVKQKGFSSSHNDILLYDNQTSCCGRYLCFAFEAICVQHQKSIFSAYEVSFPKTSFNTYLPYVFQKDSLLEAYLSVFKDVYLELESEIDHFEEALDLTTCSQQQVKELLQWIGYERYLEYCDIGRARNLCEFWESAAYQKGTQEYYHYLFKFLFDEEIIMQFKEDILHIFLCPGTIAKEKKMLLFIEREFPVFVQTQAHLNEESVLDYPVFMDINALLSDPIYLIDQHAIDIAQWVFK